jgi:hypothetical protein
MTGEPCRTRRDAGTRPGRRAGRKVTALLCAAGLVLLAGCGGGPGAKPARPLADLPAKQILAEALSAARAARSMHFDVQATSGAATVDIVGYAEPAAGRQVTTGSGGAEMTELVRPGSTYIRGNAAGLTGFVGMRARQATQLAGRWIVLHARDPGYRQITQGVTGRSVLNSVTPTGQLIKAAKLQKISGEPVIGVAGTAPASSDLPAGADAELWVAAAGKPLPVAALEVSGSSRLEVFFIRGSWAKSVTGLAAPAGAVAFPAG